MATWTAPFAASQVQIIVVGGGGGGYKDNQGPGTNGRGGGGGSGGYVNVTVGVQSDANYTYQVGSGGGVYNGGGDSYVTGPGISVYATGGQAGQDRPGGPGGSPGGNPGSGDGSKEAPGNGAGGASAYGGYGAGGQGNIVGTRGASGGGSGYVSITVTAYHAPQINVFNVGSQDSSNGIPQNDVSISWATTWATSVTLDGGGVGTSGGGQYNTGLQSVAGSNSPASRNYTLTASGPGGTVSLTRTAYVRNDNVPSNGWSTSFTNLEPNTQYSVSIGTLAGVDMPTTISASGSGNFVGNSVSGGFSGSRNFTNGESVFVRTTSAPFNTDISGLSSTDEFGKTNSKTVTISTPGGSFNVTFTTRAPKIRETFDYADNLDKYPYEDIDLIANTPTEYLTSAQVTCDDIEIPMEMKLDKPDAQISINNGTWQNVRSI